MPPNSPSIFLMTDDHNQFRPPISSWLGKGSTIAINVETTERGDGGLGWLSEVAWTPGSRFDERGALVLPEK